MERLKNSHSRPSVISIRKLKRFFREVFPDWNSAARSPRRRNGGRPSLEQLETREVLSGYTPTGLEQEFLERLNDARANPAAYGQLNGVDLSGVAPSQPLAFNTALVQSSRDHSTDMSNNNYFGHSGSDGSTPFQRMSADGFAWVGAAESIAAGQLSVEAALQGLIVDAGVPDLGHRKQLLSTGGSPYTSEQQTGVGVVMNGVGNYRDYYTIDSGNTSDARPILLGVVYSDINKPGNTTGLYDNGEGLGGVTITASGSAGTYQTTTWSSGGYSLPLVPGTYTVTASGGSLAGIITKNVTVGSSNYRLNFLPSTRGAQVVAAAVDSTAGGAAQGVILTFSEAIQGGTFTTASVDSLTGPAGAIAPTGVTQLSSTQFEVAFAPQAAAGNYTLTVGPNILDGFGNAMDQNGNGVNGEVPGDRYVTTFGLPTPSALPLAVNFDDGVAHDFISQAGSWSVAGGRYAAAPSFAAGDEVSVAKISVGWPSSVQLGVTMSAAAAAGNLYSNGFIAFDYQSATNFKFAGAYVGMQEWVVGHRDAGGWEVDAVSSDPSIAAGTNANLQLWLQGTQATLLVNGASKVGYTYASAFSGGMGLAAENSLTQFDNLTLQQPAAATLPIQENFDDGVAHYFSPQSGNWAVGAGRYGATPVGGGDAVSTLLVSGALPSSLEFDVTMNATAFAGGYYSNGFVVFDYQSPTSFKYAGAFVGNQQWVVGHRDANGWHNDAAVSDPTITPGTDFSLQLLLQGSKATLLVNGASKVGNTYTSGFTGSVGLGTENSLTRYDNLTVQQYTPQGAGTLPIQQNFDDGVAHYFSPQSGNWAVGAGRYGATPVGGGDAVSTLLVNGALPSSLEFDVLMNATAFAGGYYSNGFIVFDYQGPTNFKFAGAFVGNQQWVVGHRDANGWHNDAAVSDPGIAPGTDYNLQLLLQGGSASLLVNGTSKVGYSYASGFSGSVGLGTENSLTQFNLTVKQSS